MLLSAPFEYAFHDVFPKRVQIAWDAILSAVRMCLIACCDTPSRSFITKFKTFMVHKISAYEHVFPDTEMPRIVHLLLHVPDQVYRWNHVRNYWAFYPER